MLKRELADMERRNQEAEARHEELTGKLPDTTRPLLRQIEGMQRTAEAHSQAWQAAEQSLQARLSEAESQAASASMLLLCSSALRELLRRLPEASFHVKFAFEKPAQTLNAGHAESPSSRLLYWNVI